MGRSSKIWSKLFDNGLYDNGGFSNPTLPYFPDHRPDDANEYTNPDLLPSIEFVYDDYENLEKKILSDGQNKVIENNYLYNVIGQLTDQDVTKYDENGLNQGLIYSQDISYNNIGEIESIKNDYHGLNQISDYSLNYDGLNRLDGWTDSQSSNIGDYVYDPIGNRYTSLETDFKNLNLNYFYKTANVVVPLGFYSNKIATVNTSDNKYVQTMDYNQIGSMIERQITKEVFVGGLSSGFVRYDEEFNRTSMKRLVNRYTNRKQNSYLGCFDPPNLSDSTHWRYRFSPTGERENKRMYSREGLNGKVALPSVYYLLDDNSNQLVTYNSIEIDNYQYPITTDGQTTTMFQNTRLYEVPFADLPYTSPWYNDDWFDDRVAFVYPSEYNIYGGATNDITYMNKIFGVSDFSEEFKVIDYMGNVRYRITRNSDNTEDDYALDYSPFGSITWKSNFIEKAPRLEWIGKEFDNENGLGDFGVRKYDNLIGRFNSIDPKWNKFYSLNPYHYSLNNPVLLKDPNGDVAQIILGGAIGGGIELAFQLYDNGGDWSEVSWKKVGISAVAGGLSGGLSIVGGAAFSGASRIAFVAGGDMVIGATEEFLHQGMDIYDNKIHDFDLEKIAINGFVNAGTSSIGEGYEIYRGAKDFTNVGVKYATTVATGVTNKVVTNSVEEEGQENNNDTSQNSNGETQGEQQDSNEENELDSTATFYYNEEYTSPSSSASGIRN